MSTKPKDTHFTIYRYDNDVALAFQIDCENILKDFKKFQTFRFEIFSRLWREKQFTSIFEEQIYIGTLKVFTENCFVIIKKFLNNSDDPYVQVGALYLFYGVFYKQPYRNWMKIRLTLDEFKRLSNLIEQTKQTSFHPAFIYCKLMLDDAFKFVAIPLPLGPNEKYIKRFDLSQPEIFKSLEIDTSINQFRRFYETDTILNEFREIDREYEELKEKCLKDECLGLPQEKSSLLKEIEEVYEGLNCGELKTGEASTSRQGSIRAEIKRRAMNVKVEDYRDTKNLSNFE